MNKQFLIRDDHIGIFKDFLPNNLIDSYLNYFHNCEKQGAVYPRKEDNISASDNAIGTITNAIFLALTYNNQPFIDIFFKEIYPLYVKKYSYLKSIGPHTILDVKIQKTKVGEGYHTWHCENAFMNARNRIMAFMVYLNDVQEGGETEFLYQKCRFKPEKNTLLLWPAQYTHVHRGNPPLSNDKYIITGWIEYGY